MTKIQRVAKTVGWLIFQGKAKNQKELADLMGYTESSMSQILKEKVPLTDRFIKNLSIVDEDINMGWLLTGEGEMLKSEAKKNIDAEKDGILSSEVLAQFKQYTEIILSQQRTIEILSKKIPFTVDTVPTARVEQVK